ncbi:hypothetical protein ACFFRR_007957 [Megaselia abdita]
MTAGIDNSAFVIDAADTTKSRTDPENPSSFPKEQPKDRDKWGKDIEFLMSCIALSVGLGNVWRFPFIALENGGGAFVIPYLIVLFLVGKPAYYMEMLLGQFSTKGTIKVFDFSPAMRGIGYGQIFSTAVVTTYYATTMALTLRYFVASFSFELPWSYCREEWGDSCIPSGQGPNSTISNGSSSAELYFLNIILKEKSSIEDGIGYPNWELVVCLAVSWIVIALIMIKGIISSGKASYFLAIFPYVVMFILLIRSLTLPGAIDGVIFFLKPQWDKLLEAKVWYAAVTQVFFSLAIFFGGIIMYSSYNRFGHNIYKDCTIITSLDTGTSLLSGIIIFGILGNLAYERGTTDIQSVVKGGAGLAFISYPDAIAKFKTLPQAFSGLFFIMLFVLGIGSIVGMSGSIITVIRDQFTYLEKKYVVFGTAVVGFLIGIVYLTPGGQFLLNLVDFYGASFVAFFLAIAELISIGWIYGTKRFCQDIDFMLGIKTGVLWRISWSFVTPLLMICILAYTILTLKPITYNSIPYPEWANVTGWFLFAFGVLQLPFWGIYAFWKQPKFMTFSERFFESFRPNDKWGPSDLIAKEEYKKFLSAQTEKDMFKKNGLWDKICDNIFG